MAVVTRTGSLEKTGCWQTKKIGRGGGRPVCVLAAAVATPLSLSLHGCENHFLSIIETITQEAEQTPGRPVVGAATHQEEMITAQSIANFNYTTQHT
jgi:hypothetical protein